MRSIKPGRGPSMMGGVMAIFAGIFGIFWTVTAFSMGAGAFSLFGLVFIGIAITQAIYNFKNATSDKRYSTYDIVDSHEEPDPLNERYGAPTSADFTSASQYCPYCGEPAKADHRFCKACGKPLSD